jgi:GNAT superfamily N-acetyltransferase
MLRKRGLRWVLKNSRQFADLVDLTEERWRVWVASANDGSLIGNVWLQIVSRVPRPDGASARPLGYLTNVYVDGRHRDRGIGTALLERAIEWARAASLETLIVWPSERSVRLYERAGFASTVEPFTLQLDRS